MSFPEGCDLDVDDCSVDISQDNVVLLLRKDLPESDSNMFLLWERFSVGLNASQTTVSNIMGLRYSNPPYFYGNSPLNTEYGNGAYSYRERSYIELATYQPYDRSSVAPCKLLHF